jgi:hypothetical protein
MGPELFSSTLTEQQYAELERLVGPRSSDGNLSFEAPILFRDYEVIDKNMFYNPVLPRVRF